MRSLSFDEIRTGSAIQTHEERQIFPDFEKGDDSRENSRRSRNKYKFGYILRKAGGS